jgi:dienelactone hydrolase
MGEPLAATAVFHGMLATESPAKPGDVKGKVLVLNGGADPFVKPEEVAAFKKEMAAAKVDYKFFEYPGAKHAFTNPEATAKGKEFNLPLEYNAEATRKSKAEADKFFAQVFGKR